MRLLHFPSVRLSWSDGSPPRPQQCSACQGPERESFSSPNSFMGISGTVIRHDKTLFPQIIRPTNGSQWSSIFVQTKGLLSMDSHHLNKSKLCLKLLRVEQTCTTTGKVHGFQRACSCPSSTLKSSSSAPSNGKWFSLGLREVSFISFTKRTEDPGKGERVFTWIVSVKSGLPLAL